MQAGTFSGAQATECLDCPAGKHNTLYAASTCTKCAAGTYSGENGAQACTLCQAGKYLAGLGAKTEANCTACASGKISAQGAMDAGDCLFCPSGKVYKDASHAQWVEWVTAFSNEYNQGSWSANQVVGEPDIYPTYGDEEGSWTVSTSSSSIEWLELRFATAVEVGAVRIYETYMPGRLVKIQLLDENGQWDTVWTPPEGPEDAFLAARIFAPALEPRGYKTRQVRLEADFVAPSGFNFYMIDAVSLVSACPRVDDGWLCSNTVSE